MQMGILKHLWPNDAKPAQVADNPLKTTKKRWGTNTIVHVGVDFGTARSGWAYCTSTNSNVNVQHSYPQELNPTPKTPTELLYQRDSAGQWSVTAWGMDAHRRFTDAQANNANNLYLMKEFKLWLTDNNPAYVSDLPADFPYDAVTVVSDFLGFLREHVMDNLKITLGDDLDKENIRWCLTVPAGCSDAAKNNLRLAAQMAGLVPDYLDPRLTLAHEPEAAALTVSMENTEVAYREGEFFLVLDAGGGTVDITFHEVVRHGGKLVLSEATYRHGLAAGSVHINRLFKHFLCNSIGKETLKAWKAQYPAQWARLEEDFESMKRNFDGKKENYTNSSIRLPRTLRGMMDPEVRQALIARQQHDEELDIPFEAMKAFFDAPTDDILEALHDILGRVEQAPDRMLLVGGLGSSLYLHHCLKEELFVQTPSVHSILRAQFPYSAVVNGAALHSHTPTKIHQRRSVWTYGVEVFAPWTPDAPDCVMKDGDRMTTKGFSAFIRINDPVTVDQCVKKQYKPSFKGQSCIEFPIYASSSVDVKFTSQPDVHKVGTVVIPIKSGTKLVEVRFKFGMADIQVVAKDGSRNKVSTRIQFDQHVSMHGIEVPL